MKPNSRLASAIQSSAFLVTAEILPPPAAEGAAIRAAADAMGDSLAAVSVADNHSGIGTSSLAASSVLLGLGREPIYQVVTRDRNRIAIQSDLLGAAVLGIKNVVCTSGHHQTLIGCSESANVYDVDAIQVIWAVRRMRDEGTLLNGTAISGTFSMLIGTVASPYLRPLDLNMIQLAKKVGAGADFIQTQPVFDVDEFALWLDAIRQEGLADKAAIFVGILPLSSAEEAENLRQAHTESRIPDALVARLKDAGSADAQEREGLKICAEIIGRLKGMKGVRGIHILSGGREKLVSKLRAAAGL
ncbi:MAG: methylenetetrahydrofolate reductase [Sedimentisphaerales bacterium]|nr:methylenetetrahydrofolate reductase [Sedimentisphaerales bacterium]